MNDIMNVWVILWLANIARLVSSITFMNIDSFKLGHNFHDTLDIPFYTTYKKNFHHMLKGESFEGKTVCMQEVLMQPVPPKFFVWGNWFKDAECTFRGPSSLFQRWNILIRKSYGLLPSDSGSTLNIDTRLQILMIVRTETKNLWGSNRSSRNTVNQDEVTTHLSTVIGRLGGAGSPVKFIVKSLESMSFEQQVKLASESSIIIGMHGAGKFHL
jgi:hypothetical protein